MQVKDLATSSERFSKNASAAQPYYQKGVQAAGAKWKAAVEASEENWSAGVNAAIARGAFRKGVARAGADYYTSRAMKLGAGRYQEGVREGAGNWSEGFKPFADTLGSLQLSAKGPAGDARNQTRSVEVQIALRRKKEELA